MPVQQRIPLGLQSYQDRSLPISAQRLLNLYAEAKPEGSKAQVAVHSTPGLKPWTTVGSGPVRGLHLRGDTLYVLSGNELWRVTEAKAKTLAGTIGGAALGRMANNGDELVVVNQVETFVDDGTTLITQATPFTPSDVTFHDGYMVFTVRNDQKFFISALNDAQTYDATEFALANSEPDQLVGLRNLNRETWLFGTDTVQIYYNSGAADFPFTRTPSGVIQVGCLSRDSIQDYRGVAFWLGSDRRVYRSQQQQALPISTPPIEREIRGYASPDESSAIVYEQDGHVFYCLRFAEASWVFDLATGLWHERKSPGADNWNPRVHAFAFAKNLVGDSSTGEIYELDLDTYEAVRREMVPAPLHADGNRVFVNAVELDIETGVGVQTGQGSDPQVMLDCSNDGGRTWGSEHWRTIGAIGDYTKRVRWTALGSAYNRVLRFAISDPVKVAIAGVYANVEVTEA